MTEFTKLDCYYYSKLLNRESCFCNKKTKLLICSENKKCPYYEKINSVNVKER